MLRPAVALYIADTTGNPLLVGAVVSIQALLPLIIAMPVGSLSDRLGFRLSAALGASGMFVAGWLYLGVPSILGLAGAQVVEGVGELFVWTALQASASRLGEGEAGNKQERYIGYFTLAVSVGQLLGPLSTGLLLGTYNYQVVFSVFIVVAAILATLCWTAWLRDRTTARVTPAEKGVPEGARETPLTIAGNPIIRASLLSSFSMLFVTGVFTSFFPILLRDHMGYTEAAVGVFLAVRTSGAFVVRPLVAAILGRFGLTNTMLTSTAIAVLTLAVVPNFGHPLTLGAVMFIAGLAMGLNNPLTMLVIAKYTSAAQRGLGMGMRLFVNRAAHVVSPLIFGGTAGALGLQAGFYSSGGLLAFVVVLIGKLARAAPTAVEGSQVSTSSAD